MVVHTTVERCRRVFSNARAYQSLAAGMLVDKIRHIVDHARNDDKSFASLSFGNEVVPFDDW